MLVALSGCQRVCFYRQAIAGQYEILAHKRPIHRTHRRSRHASRNLKAKLGQILKIRDFAASQLKLPADGNYFDTPISTVLMSSGTVNVAPPLSLEAKTWWFPVAGARQLSRLF